MTTEELKSVACNEDFINLIAAAQDDSNLKNRLLSVLRSDDLTRNMAIQEWISSCNKNVAPRSFIEALSYFMHKEVAYTAIKLLSA